MMLNRLPLDHFETRRRLAEVEEQLRDAEDDLEHERDARYLDDVDDELEQKELDAELGVAAAAHELVRVLDNDWSDSALELALDTLRERLREAKYDVGATTPRLSIVRGAP